MHLTLRHRGHALVPFGGCSVNDRFPNTAWTEIRNAKLDGSEAGAEAMNRFVIAYWRPIYCFLRAKGYKHDRAEELTQEFLFQLIQRDWLGRADPQRGRLRNYILRILIRFLSDQGPRRAPRQSQFEHSFVAVSTLVTADDRCFDPPSDSTPEEIFERSWAVSLVKDVLRLLELSYDAQDRRAWYEIFAINHGFTENPEKPTQEELAQRFGITRDKVRYAQDHARQRFEQLLCAEIRCQVGEQETNEETERVLSLIGS